MMDSISGPAPCREEVARVLTDGPRSSAAERLEIYRFGYVARLVESDGTHYGALRVAFVGPDYVVFDWAYQSAVGNPELSRGGVVGALRP